MDMNKSEQLALTYCNKEFPLNRGAAVVPIGIHDLNEKERIASHYGFIAGHTAAQEEHRWIAVSERKPTEDDTNDVGDIEIMSIHGGKYYIDSIQFDDVGDELVVYEYWRTPLSDNFPPKQ